MFNTDANISYLFFTQVQETIQKTGDYCPWKDLLFRLALKCSLVTWLGNSFSPWYKILLNDDSGSLFLTCTMRLMLSICFFSDSVEFQWSWLIMWRTLPRPPPQIPGLPGSRELAWSITLRMCCHSWWVDEWGSSCTIHWERTLVSLCLVSSELHPRHVFPLLI